jgi:hypothetical protein
MKKIFMNTTFKILLLFMLSGISSCNVITRINYPTPSPALAPVAVQSNGNGQTFTILPSDTGLSIGKLDYLSLSFVAPAEKYIVNFTLDTSRMQSESDDSIYMVGGLVSFSKQYECVVNYSLSKSVVRNTRFYKQGNGDYDFYIPGDTVNNPNVRSLYQVRQLSPTLQDSMLKGYRFEMIDPNGNYFRFVTHSDPFFLIPWIVTGVTAAYTSYKIYKASKTPPPAGTKTGKRTDCQIKAKASASYPVSLVRYNVVRSNCD